MQKGVKKDEGTERLRSAVLMQMSDELAVAHGRWLNDAEWEQLRDRLADVPHERLQFELLTRCESESPTAVFRRFDALAAGAW